MPLCYLPAARPELCQQVCARLSAGETLGAICADPAIPDPSTLHAWMRKDAAFADAFRAAKRMGAWRRNWMFDEAKAKALLARLAARERITSVLADPAMPSVHVYRYWRATQGEFAEAVHRINAHKAVLRVQHLAGTFRHYDDRVADRVVLAVARGARLLHVREVHPSVPGRNTVKRWRKERPEFDAMLREAIQVRRRRERGTCPGCTPELIEHVCGRIAEGATLHSLGRREGLPRAATLYAWIAARRDFAERVQDACDFRDQALEDSIAETLERVRPRSAKAARALLRPQLAKRQMYKRPGRRWEVGA